MIIELAGYRCRNCCREFMLREPIPDNCTASRHVLDYVMLKRELPYD